MYADRLVTFHSGNSAVQCKLVRYTIQIFVNELQAVESPVLLIEGWRPAGGREGS
jgi:hypothetical protein